MSENGHSHEQRRRRCDADQGRLPVRPGNPLVPGLRRLRDPRQRPGADARTGGAAGEDGLHLRHRLRRALRLLHGHLRDARHPRPRAGPGDRDRDLARGPLGLGRQRRRRLALDRRQPPDPRPAPQRADQAAALQQPDLRPDQGPVLADQRDGQDHQVDPVRLRGPPLQPARPRARRRRLLRRPHDRRREEARHRDPARRRRARGLVLRRDLPELQRLQRRRLRRGPRQGRRPEPDPARARPADPLRRRERARRHPRRQRRPRGRRRRRGRRGRARRPRRPRRGPQPRHRPRPPRRQPHRADPDRRLPRRQAPGLRLRAPARSWSPPTPARRLADVDELLRSGDTWTV